MMKTFSKMKKATLALFAFVFAIALVFGVNLFSAKTVYADGETDPSTETETTPVTGFFMVEGASIRNEVPNGIRFTTAVGEGTYNEEAEYFTLIYPTVKLNGKTIQAALENGDIEEKDLVKIPLKNRAYKMLEYMEEGYIYFHAVLIGEGEEQGLPEILWDKQLTAQSYYTTDGGKTKTWTEENNSRSMAYIAAAELADGYEEELYLTIVNKVLEGKMLTLNLSEKTVLEGETAEFSLTEAPTDVGGTAYPAKWTSDNESVATVSKNGTVTAVSAGTATITATIGNKTATATVTVKNELSLAKSAFTLFKDSTSANHTATPVFMRGSEVDTTSDIVWSDAESNSSVATIDTTTGEITAVGYGTTTFVATSNETYDNGKQFIVTVNVDLPAVVAPLATTASNIRVWNNVANVTYDTANKYGEEAGSLKVTRRASGEIYLTLDSLTTSNVTDYNYLVFHVYNAAAANASVSVCWVNGIVCAPGEWTEVVIKLDTALIQNIYTGKDIPLSNLTSFALRVFSGSMNNGESLYISNVLAKVYSNMFIADENGEKLTSASAFVGGNTPLKIYQDGEEYSGSVTWTSSDDGVATVAADGTVTGVTEGTVTITAVTAEEETASITVNVGPALHLDSDSVKLFMGDETELSVVQGENKYTGEIAWSVDDEGVVTVDEDGIITTVGTGSTTIYAVVGDTELTAGVTVYDATKSVLSFADTSASRRISIDNNLMVAVDTSVKVNGENTLKVVHYAYKTSNYNFLTITTPDNTDISAYNYIGFDVYNPTNCRWPIALGDASVAANGETTQRQVMPNGITRVVWPVSYFDGASSRGNANNLTGCKFIIFSVAADVKLGDALWFSSITAYGREEDFHSVTTNINGIDYIRPDDDKDGTPDTDTFTVDTSRTLVYAFSQTSSNVSTLSTASFAWSTEQSVDGNSGSTKWSKNGSNDAYIRLDRVLALNISSYKYIMIKIYNPHNSAFMTNFTHGGYTWLQPKQWTTIKIALSDFDGKAHDNVGTPPSGVANSASAWNFQVMTWNSWSGTTINGNFTNIRWLGLRIRPLTGTWPATNNTTVYLSDIWATNE